jgi:hypothetical protein
MRCCCWSSLSRVASRRCSAILRSFAARCWSASPVAVSFIPPIFALRLRQEKTLQATGELQGNGQQSAALVIVGEKLTGGKQAGQWAEGQSGNPAGRPRGSRNRLTKACADLLGDAAPDIMERLIKMAGKGHPVALKLCVERMLPARAARDRWVELAVPVVAQASDLVTAAAAVIERAAAGEITLSEAKEFMALIDSQRRAIETADLAVRIEALESGPLADSDGVVRMPAIDEAEHRALVARVRVAMDQRRGVQ